MEIRVTPGTFSNSVLNLCGSHVLKFNIENLFLFKTKVVINRVLILSHHNNHSHDKAQRNYKLSRQYKLAEE